MLVDYLGKIPFTQANQFGEFPMPELDEGQVVYDAVFDLLDTAIANLSRETINLPTSDLYYGADADKWIKLANTLKIRMYLNLRLTQQGQAESNINSILASGNFIDDASEDFVFQFTAAGPPVESRHPFFTTSYLPGGAGTYQSNYYIYLLKDDKSSEDPRLDYYYYRQTATDPEGQSLPCAGNSAYDFCYVGDAYWARDHADAEGLPADGLLRTTYGIYPGGGAYDGRDINQIRNQAEDDYADLTPEEQAAISEADFVSNALASEFINGVNANGSGLTGNGAGIYPIFTSSFTHFSLAEAALTTGVNGNPLDYLKIGIEQSFAKVSGFLGAPEIDQEEIDDYIEAIETEYNAASADGKLFVIGREYYLALFGNGVEAYNLYRRTGMPVNPDNPDGLESIQDPVLNQAGPFPRLFRYPQNAVNNNNNVRDNQNQFTDRVFWDTNPAGFIN